MIELVVKVPKGFMEDSQDFGMLDPQTIAQVLRDELDERIMKFVDAEVKAYRTGERTKRA